MLKQVTIAVLSTVVGLSTLVVDTKKAEAQIEVVYPTRIETPFADFILEDRTTFEIPVLDLEDIIGPVCTSCPPNIFEPLGWVEFFDPEIARVSEIFTGFNTAINLTDVFPEASPDALKVVGGLFEDFSAEAIQFTSNTVFGESGKGYDAEFIADVTVQDLPQFFSGDSLKQVSELLANSAPDARIVIAQHNVPIDDLIAKEPEAVPEPGTVLGLSTLVLFAGRLKRQFKLN
ncbi:MAG: PEP-CTERM sorting domain-containing protein [Microcoleaceae cyanobacterium]